MRLALTALVMLALVFTFGCVNVKKTVDSEISTPPEGELGIPTPDEPAEDTPGDEPGTSEDGAPLEVDQSELGLYDEPGGDLPAYVPADADEGIEYVVKYADVDGDGTRDVLSITEPSKKAGGKQPKGVRVALLCWDQSKDAWWAWNQLTSGREETMFDEDSFAFAYDLNLDGMVEVGLMFYEEKTFTDEPGTNLYIYQAREDGLYPVTSDVLQAMDGGAITSLPGDSFIIADVEDTYPGEEIVLSQARTGSDKTAPYAYDMFVYCWDETKGYYSLARSYRSAQEFDDADTAFIAFRKGEGDFDPLTFN